MIKTKPFFRIINELCEELNIKQTWLSYEWIDKLEKDGKTHFIIGNHLDINSANSYQIAKDKYATYAVLSSNNIPMIEHNMIFSPYSRSHYYKEEFIKRAKELLRQYNNKIVIKANDSYEGKDVYICESDEQIDNLVNRLFDENKNTLSACPYIDIKYEYRCIFLDGEVIYIYKKRKPYVTGDGKSTLGDLINKKYADYSFEYFDSLNLKSIPSLGEEITISWKHNLNNGAEPIVVSQESDPMYNEVKKLATDAAKAIGISFASVDISQTEDFKHMVMEINGSVCMNKFSDLVDGGYEIAKDIFRRAILKMFEK